MSEAMPVVLGRGGGTPALQDLRVLFLPKNSRTAYFRELLATARRDLNWDVQVVGPQFERSVWQDSLRADDAMRALPDFAKLQAWESDPARVAEIDALIGDCERASGMSAGRILLAGERDIGRGFSRRFYYWFNNTIASRSLRDNSFPSQVVRRLFAFARDTIETVKPDLVIAGEWADPLCFVFYLVAQKKGIRCAVNRPSKLWSGRCYWSTDFTWYNLSARAYADEKRAAHAAPSERAVKRISDFRSAPQTLGYVRKNWDSDERRTWIHGHKELARLFGAQVRRYFDKRGGPEAKPAFQLAVDHYRKPLLRWRQSGFFRRYEAEELKRMRYVYIAMHKDPEQALNGQAPFWSNQYNTAALLSGALPAGYRLLVREHRRNTGRRPTAYYRNLSRLPSVVLIDAFDDQFKYISNADLIVTEDGSTGWEGMVLKRRVITLADNFYQGSGLGYRLRDPELLAQTMIDLLAQEPVSNADVYDQSLGWMLDAEWETTIPLDPVNGTHLGLLAEVLAGPERSSKKTTAVA
jgi:hypothetical protein